MDRARAAVARGMQEAPAMVLGMVGDAPGGKALSGEILSTGDLWRMSPDNLQSMMAEKAAADRQGLVRAFGSEDAASEFTRLDRKQNSNVPRIADEGAREFESRFGTLTPDQERLAYGIGETGPQHADIKEVLNAHSARAGDPLDAAYDAAIAIRRAPAADILAVPSGNASPTAQAAYVRLMNAYEDMRTAGVPADRVGQTIMEGLVQRGGWSPANAAEVVGSFLQEMRNRAGSTGAASPPRLQLPRPQQ